MTSPGHYIEGIISCILSLRKYLYSTEVGSTLNLSINDITNATKTMTDIIIRIQKCFTNINKIY